MRRAAVLVALLLGAAIAVAAPRAEAPPPWSGLTPAQRQALEPLHADWPRIDANGKQRWLSVVERFPKMSEAERARVQQRMTEWARMTPTERARARLQFQQSRQFPAEDRQASWQAYQALPEEDRKRLAERAGPTGKAPRPVPAAVRSETQPKTTIVTPRREAPARAVAPAVIQAAPGATTRLMSTPPSAPPPPYQSGLPKIVATDGFVNPNTLLPRRGPQGAAVRSPAASEPARP